MVRDMSKKDGHGEVALVAGVGTGLGAALARRFAGAGMKVAIVARNKARLAPLAGELADLGGEGRAYGCDVTDADGVKGLFASLLTDFGAPDLVVYNAGGFIRKKVLETEPAEFEGSWRAGCLGGFLVAFEAARLMVANGGGTILFTGATASLRGGAGRGSSTWRWVNSGSGRWRRAWRGSWGRKACTSPISSSTDRSIPSVTPTSPPNVPRRASRARCHRRELLPAPSPASQRLDPGDGSPALGRTLLGRRMGQVLTPLGGAKNDSPQRHRDTEENKSDIFH